jgi:hypothetical protein
MCRLLVVRGADRRIKNAQNKIPLDLASNLSVKVVTTPLEEEEGIWVSFLRNLCVDFENFESDDESFE